MNNNTAPRWDRTLSLQRTNSQKHSSMMKMAPLNQLSQLSHTSDAVTASKPYSNDPQTVGMRTTRSTLKNQGGLVGLTRTVSGVVKRRKHVVLLGLDGSGKTTILMRLKYGCQVATVPTIGFNHEKVWGGGFRWSAWDVGGGEKLRPLWVMYARATDGLVFVVDASSNNDVIEESRVELSRVVKASKASAHNLNVAPPPVLVLANFQDRTYARGPEDIAVCLGLSEQWASGIMWAVAPVCGLTGDGLEEALNTLRALIDGTKKERRKVDKGGPPKGPPRWRW